MDDNTGVEGNLEERVAALEEAVARLKRECRHLRKRAKGKRRPRTKRYLVRL